MSDHIWHSEYVFIKNKYNEYNSKKNTGLIIFFIFIVLILFVAVRFLLLPKFRIEKIYIESNLNVSNEEILKRAGLNQENLLYFSVDSGLVENRLSGWPMVKSVKVEKLFPDSLKISISSRDALAYIIVDNNGIIFPAVCDEEGIVFDAGKDIMYKNLPVISGIAFKDFIVGAKLPDTLVAFMDKLNKIKNNNFKLFSVISEIKFVKRGDYLFDYFIYFKGIKLPVLVSDEISESLLKYALLIIDVIASKANYQNLEYVDLRGDVVSYKLRSDNL